MVTTGIIIIAVVLVAVAGIVYVTGSSDSDDGWYDVAETPEEDPRGETLNVTEGYAEHSQEIESPQYDVEEYDDTESDDDDPLEELYVDEDETIDISPVLEDLEDLDGIGPAKAQRIRVDGGFETPQDLHEATDSELLDVFGIGPQLLEDIRGQLARNHGIGDD